MSFNLKSPVFRGTMILILVTGLVRIIGFFYKIFLTKLLTPYDLGIYQMIFPIFGICYTLYASGLQTGISSLTAQAKNHTQAIQVLKTGLFISLSIASLLSLLLFQTSDQVATKLLNEPACAPSLRILSLAFPFCGLSSCICGYYYGVKKSKVPALEQLLEQIARVVIVISLAMLLGAFSSPALDASQGTAGSAIMELPHGNSSNPALDASQGTAGSAIMELPHGNSSNNNTSSQMSANQNLHLTISPNPSSHFCELAVFGILAGEVVSAVYCLLSVKQSLKKKEENQKHSFFSFHKSTKKSDRLTSENSERSTFSIKKRMYAHTTYIILPLLRLCLPLTFSRLLLSLLHSAEALLVPFALQKHGLNSQEAVSQFGVLTGMALPIILFPSTLPSCACVLLLPAISHAKSKNNMEYIIHQCKNAVLYSIIFGLGFTVIFLFLGKPIGLHLFSSPLAGNLILLLSLVCPFLYLSTTLGSILNGLGMTISTFWHTLVGLFVQLGLMLLLVSQYGMEYYAISLLCGQAITARLNYSSLKRKLHFELRPRRVIRELFTNYNRRNP